MKNNNLTQNKTIAAAGFLVLLILVVLSYRTAEEQADPLQTAITGNPIIPQVSFQFDVYCPVDS